MILNLFYRAKKIRPKHADPTEGIVKNRNAIINSLSSCSGKYIYGEHINVSSWFNVYSEFGANFFFMYLILKKIIFEIMENFQLIGKQNSQNRYKSHERRRRIKN